MSTSDRTQLQARSIGIVEGDVTRIVVENDQLRGVEVGGERLIARDAVFVPPRFVPNNHLLTALDCQVDDAGWVVADSTGRTSLAGVWVAGNVVNPRARSSPPQVRDQPRQSRSTPISSKRTFATQSGTSISDCVV